MKNDSAQANFRRGSSPPFQETEQGAHEWVTGPKPIGLNSENTPGTQAPQQHENEKVKSFDDGESQHGKDDESRWQADPPTSLWRDDGGESGEVV